MSSVLGFQPTSLIHAVLDEVGVAIAVVDNKKRFVFTNQAAREMFGAADNLSVIEWRRSYKLHDRQGRRILAGHGPVARALAGEEVPPHEVRITRPDGNIKWLHVAAHPFSVMGLTGVLIFIADETEQVELRKAIERFRRIEEFAIMAGGLAHDFNNILSLVSENAALALGDGNLEDIQSRLRQMRIALKKGSVLVARLKAYSRTKDVEMHPVQINDVVNAALELTRPLMARRVSVKTEISPNLPKVAADSSRLEQVLVNLILNALDAMPEGGELTVCTQLASSDAVTGGPKKENKQFVLVTVTDTGIGIPENLQCSIFDPFFTTKPNGEGVGLGLSSAQAIVRQHDGFIDVQSAPGKGTTFRMFLPAKERPASKRSGSAARSRRPFILKKKAR
jgi:PAS domain S-box-containing protein